MTRTLIVAPQWIGDAVMTEPLLARLAARDETLTVAALPWVAPVYRAMPQVAEIIELPFAHGRLDWARRRQVAAQWRGRFDVAYVLPNSIKAALVPWLAGIPLRIGYQGEGRPLLLHRRLRNPKGRPPMVAFYSALADVVPETASAARAGTLPSARQGPDLGAHAASSQGSSPDAIERPRLRLDTTRLQAAAAQAGTAPGDYFVFAPGAEYGPAKCWPAEHYASLARSLYQEHERPVLLLGSPKEQTLCEQIAQAAPQACHVLAGQTTLLDAIALIAGARAMASNDSGLMHVAAAFGVPQVAMFGSTSPEHTPPLNARAQVLWLKHELALDCAPCFERRCRYGHTRCLTEITPQRAAEALRLAMHATPP